MESRGRYSYYSPSFRNPPGTTSTSHVPNAAASAASSSSSTPRPYPSPAVAPPPSSSHVGGTMIDVVAPVVSLEDDDDDDEAVRKAERRLLRARALSSKLSQYTRGSDRRQVLRTLLDMEHFPRIHEIGTISGIDDIAKAEREAASERATLNGVNFMKTVREVCGHMCGMDGVNADPMALYGGLLLRLCRSASERDALETITFWTSCKSGELVPLPLGRRHHRPGSNAPPPEPAGLEIYVEGGNVHARVTMRHEIGLYRRVDLESGENGSAISDALRSWNDLVDMAQVERAHPHPIHHRRENSATTGTTPSGRKKRGGGPTSSSSDDDTAARRLTNMQYEALSLMRFSSGHKNFHKPWVYFNVDVVERINFGTGSSVRVLHVGIPDDKNRGYVVK